MLSNLTIAHRGAHNNNNIPENSLLAFQKAIELNLPIELDIQITKDNKLVIFHDNNLKRMTGENKLIQDLTYEEIKNLKLLNTKEKIPTFKEVLNLVKGKVLIDIEIKTTKKKEEIAKSILKELNNYKGEIIIKSFNPFIIKLIKKQTDKYKLGLLITDKYDNKFIDFLYKINIPCLYLKPDFIAIKKSLLTKKTYKKYIKKYNIFIWTIKSKKEDEKFKNKYLNITCICNNIIN